MYKFGFIGTGNMGGALAQAVVESVGGENVLLSDKAVETANKLAENLNCNCADSNAVADKCNYIFLGVKPQILPMLINEIAPVLKNRKDRFVLVTMAAGVKIETLEKMLDTSYPIIRIMPNTPVSKGKGMIQYCSNNAVTDEEIKIFVDSLKYAGKVDSLDEKLIDAASAVSGCGPAFAYLFAEALADAGVECGLPRNKAIEYASQMLSGAAELLLTTGKHPGVLKDEVCSPGGTTIAGVHALEDNGFRGAVMSAVKAAYDRTIELSK